MEWPVKPCLPPLTSFLVPSCKVFHISSEQQHNHVLDSNSPLAGSTVWTGSFSLPEMRTPKLTQLTEGCKLQRVGSPRCGRHGDWIRKLKVHIFPTNRMQIELTRSTEASLLRPPKEKKKSEPMGDIHTHSNHGNGQYLIQKDSHVAFSNIDNYILGVK